MIADPHTIYQAIPQPEGTSLSGTKKWRSPSNIALIKYWGKRDIQIPANPSLSFTLRNSYTETTLHYEPKATTKRFELICNFEGSRNEKFEQKLYQFFERCSPYFSFLEHFSFVVDTRNSFPHSSGIASSASGMSALALCLCSIEKDLSPAPETYPFIQKASFISRLGSGSACRSVYGGITVWGAHSAIAHSHDEWAVPYPFEVDEVFSSFQDTILLVDKGQKKVSSSLGHDLMNSNPFSQQRFETAVDRLEQLSRCINSKDLEGFGKIIEQEALMLHALMMTSDPYFVLLKPNSLEILQKVWEFRNQNDVKLYITMDAGANVHLLYPEFEKNKVLKFIDSELVAFCENKQYLCDEVGFGPQEITEE